VGRAEGGGRTVLSARVAGAATGRRSRWNRCGGFTPCSCGPTDRGRVVEEPLHGSVALRGRGGVDLGAETVPDEMTARTLRHLPKRTKLAKELLATVNEHRNRNASEVVDASIVDAATAGAPSSARNTGSKRDPGVYEAAKRTRSCVGVSAHVGVGSRPSVSPRSHAAQSALPPRQLNARCQTAWRPRRTE
jgi:hypothetical protein